MGRRQTPSEGLLGFEPISTGNVPSDTALPASARTAFLAGKVVDQTGRAVPGATVLVTAPGAGGEPTRETSTDPRGWFRLDGLITGQRYLVVVTAFRPDQPLLARASIVAPRDRVLITVHRAGELPAESSSSLRTTGNGWIRTPEPERRGPGRFVRQGRTPPSSRGTADVAPSRARSPQAAGQRTVSDGVSLRRFIGRLFGRSGEAEQPALEVPRQQRSTPPPSGAADPGRPFAELPVPRRPPPRWQSNRGTERNRGRELSTPLRLAEEGRSSGGASAWRPASTPLAKRQRSLPGRPSVARSAPHSTLRTTVRKAAPSTDPVRPASFWTGRAAELADLNLPNADLHSVRLGSLDGQLLLVDFWASWCGACLRAMPRIETLHRMYGRHGLTVVGVAYESGDVRQQAGRVREVASRLQVTYPLLLGSADTGNKLRNVFGVRVLPTLVLLDRRGNLLWRSDGFDEREFARLQEIIRARLAVQSTRRPQ